MHRLNAITQTIRTIACHLCLTLSCRNVTFNTIVRSFGRVGARAPTLLSETIFSGFVRGVVGGGIIEARFFTDSEGFFRRWLQSQTHQERFHFNLNNVAGSGENASSFCVGSQFGVKLPRGEDIRVRFRCFVCALQWQRSRCESQ